MKEYKQEFTEILSVIISLESGPISINAKDIQSVYFIEDIFSYCMKGKLTFLDMYGLMEHGPLTGNEQITIIYGEDEDRQLIFDIWKVSKVQQTSPTDMTAENLMEIYFVDTVFELYTMKRYSKSFTGLKKTTDIIKEILKNIIGHKNKSINIEDSTTDITNFIIPYWNLMESISWLLKRSQGKDSNTSGYVCYNSTEEGFRTNIYSLNTLFGNKNYLEDEIYTFEGDQAKKNKVLNWWISGLDKHSTKVIRGGKWKGYDSATKSFLNLEYTYEDGIADSVLLGKKSLYNDISDINTVNRIMGEKSLESLQDTVYSEWVRRYCMQQVVNVYVRGHERRYAGQQIKIQWPSTERHQIYNKMLEGKYLVKSITHMFSGGSNFPYRQRLILLKNAYSDIDMVGLLKATKMNT